MSEDLKRLSIVFTHKELCTRCGTCVGVCPQKALTLDKDLFPTLDTDKCTKCGICQISCPGGQVSFKELSQLTFGNEYVSKSFDGQVLHTFVGYSDDIHFRKGGAGGGVVTSLLWDLLKNKDVDGCIVTRMNPDKPWLGEPFIARSYEDLLASQGSKYTIIPVNSILQIVRDSPGKFACVALPCQVHGIRLAMQNDPKLREKIALILGLFCGGSLEPFIVRELLQMKGLKEGDIQNFEFRGGDWPGKMRAILNDGNIVNMHYSNYKDGAYNYFISIYMPKRCQTCVDGSNEFSDISVSDAWTRDTTGKYKFQAHSRMLVRTHRGLDIVEKSQSRGALYAKDVSTDQSYQTHKIQTRRKGVSTPIRISRLLKKAKPAPIYDRPEIKPTIKEQFTERVISSCLYLGQFKWIRYPLIKFLTSRYSIPLITLRQYIKKRKYKK
jgi:coenzyme F420 hydrogenase subunit beta